MSEEISSNARPYVSGAGVFPCAPDSFETERTKLDAKIKALITQTGPVDLAEWKACRDEKYDLEYAIWNQDERGLPPTKLPKLPPRRPFYQTLTTEELTQKSADLRAQLEAGASAGSEFLIDPFNSQSVQQIKQQLRSLKDILNERLRALRENESQLEEDLKDDANYQTFKETRLEITELDSTTSLSVDSEQFLYDLACSLLKNGEAVIDGPEYRSYCQLLEEREEARINTICQQNERNCALIEYNRECLHLISKIDQEKIRSQSRQTQWLCAVQKSIQLVAEQINTRLNIKQQYQEIEAELHARHARSSPERNNFVRDAGSQQPPGAGTCPIVGVAVVVAAYLAVRRWAYQWTPTLKRIELKVGDIFNSIIFDT